MFPDASESNLVETQIAGFLTHRLIYNAWVVVSAEYDSHRKVSTSHFVVGCEESGGGTVEA